MSSSETILSVRNLSVALPKGADRKFAVEDANLEVHRREIVCVIGESGSGKSVLSAAVMGAVPPPLRVASGSVQLQGEEVTTASASRLRELRGSKVAMIFQEPMAALNPAIPIGRQLEEVFELHAPQMGREERARIGVLGRREDALDPALLDDAALLHDADPVGDLAHDAEVVGDEQHGHAEPAL